ncbi:hypothetical protein OHT76_32930 [Streptomyces sp. NBC_00287]|uniref:hypothetical protein n=1 Tax=Streptomyces sp. NBC_00287 TaxID=2975702 RepID=UPI002E2C0B44|nr:hypothetical protein [Streptomyces sp. NBC_00287]
MAARTQGRAGSRVRMLRRRGVAVPRWGLTVSRVGRRSRAAAGRRRPAASWAGMRPLPRAMAWPPRPVVLSAVSWAGMRRLPGVVARSPRPVVLSAVSLARMRRLPRAVVPPSRPAVLTAASWAPMPQ